MALRERAVIIDGDLSIITDDWDYISLGKKEGWLTYDIWFRDCNDVLWHKYIFRKRL